jgi:hypothetical protein
MDNVQKVNNYITFSCLEIFDAEERGEGVPNIERKMIKIRIFKKYQFDPKSMEI